MWGVSHRIHTYPRVENEVAFRVFVVSSKGDCRPSMEGYSLNFQAG